MCMLDLDRAGCIVRGPGMLMNDDDEQQVLTRDETMSFLSVSLLRGVAGRDETLVLFYFSQLPGSGRGSRCKMSCAESALCAAAFGDAGGIRTSVVRHEGGGTLELMRSNHFVLYPGG